MANRHKFLSGARIEPRPVTGDMTVADMVETAFLAYNAARLREGCQLFVEKG
jgi:deoxyhypusine synthase